MRSENQRRFPLADWALLYGKTRRTHRLRYLRRDVKYQELVATGDVKTADRIALSLRRAGLVGLSGYMRRTAMFRVRSGSRMASPEEMQADEETVLRIADELDALADDPTADVNTFETVTNKLRKMGVFPDSELYSAAVQIFLLKAAA
jgi:hypothetical protein